MKAQGVVIQKLWNTLFRSRLRLNIGYTLGRQLLAGGAQLVLVVIIARALGPEGNGQYALAILLPTLMVNLLNFGIGPATVYFVGRGEISGSQAIIGNLRFGLMVAAIGFAGGLPLIYFFGDVFFSNVSLGLLLLGVAIFPFSLLLGYLSTILQGLEDFRAFNATTLVPPYVALAGAAVALLFLGMGTYAAVTAYLVGQCLGLVVTITVLRRKQRGDSEREPLPGQTRRVIGFGWKAHLSNILAFVNYRADILLVNFFLTPAATGIYVIAVQIAERLWMLSQAASTVLLPRLSAMHADPVARLRLTNRSFGIVLLLTAFAGILGALALYWLLVPVFGAEYVEAMGAFLWLLPGIIAGAGARVQSNCIAAAGKPEWNMYVSVLVVAMNVVLNIILIPFFGIIGAAMATSVAYFVNAAVKYYLVRKTVSAADALSGRGVLNGTGL